MRKPTAIETALDREGYEKHRPIDGTQPEGWTIDGRWRVVTEEFTTAAGGDNYASSGWTAYTLKPGDLFRYTFINQNGSGGDFIEIIPLEWSPSGRSGPAFAG